MDRAITLTFQPWRPLSGLRARLAALRKAAGRVERAHDRRCTVQALGEGTLRDTGLCPETAAGQSLWQEDLPFYLQGGFGRR